MSNRLAEPVIQTDTASFGAGTATVTTASGSLIAANGGRVEITVTNLDATNAVFLGLGTAAAANSGIYLAPKASYTTRAFTGQVFAIAITASCTVAFVEIA